MIQKEHAEKLNVEELFGRNVFTMSKMRERLPDEVYAEVQRIIREGGDLSLRDADIVFTKGQGLSRVQLCRDMIQVKGNAQDLPLSCDFGDHGSR